MGAELSTESGQKAAKIMIAQKYIEEFGKIVGKSNSIIVPSDANDISGFIAKAIGISGFVKSKGDEKQKSDRRDVKI
jgi:hypothetical protein